MAFNTPLCQSIIICHTIIPPVPLFYNMCVAARPLRKYPSAMRQMQSNGTIDLPFSLLWPISSNKISPVQATHTESGCLCSHKPCITQSSIHQYPLYRYLVKSSLRFPGRNKLWGALVAASENLFKVEFPMNAASLAGKPFKFNGQRLLPFLANDLSSGMQSP